MIDVDAVLADLPPFTGFQSVERLRALAEAVGAEVVGHSRQGRPIHRLTAGSGPVKALVVGGPHCNEPIGSVTVSALMTLFGQGHPGLVGAGVEWHVVPCIDPDGAVLNEDWTQRPFSLESYMRGYHLQAPADQVDTSFPMRWEQLRFDQPSAEARVLKGLIDAVGPDFYYPLHNAWTGGAFFHLSRDIGQDAYARIRAGLDQADMPLQTRPIWAEICAQYAPGFTEIFRIGTWYEHIRRSGADVAAVPLYGAGSWDYLAELKPDALTFVTEVGYARHPADESEAPVEGNLRQLKVRLDAENVVLASLIVEAWDRVHDDLDRSSPFYDAVRVAVIEPLKADPLQGGMPVSRWPTREILTNPAYDRPMTSADRFNACIVDGGFVFLPIAHQVVRLLRASPQTGRVREATRRLETEFEAALGRLDALVGLDRFETVDPNVLARVQLGSGLIALNTLLAEGARS